MTVSPSGSLQPDHDVTATTWQTCTPRSVAGCTAVGFYFGRALLRELDVPVGLIHASVGGSPIEGWMRRDVLDTFPSLRTSTAAGIERMRSQPDDARKYPAERDRWERKYGVAPPENQGLGRGWADPAFDDRDWKTVRMPARWAEAADVDSGGVFWLRKDVTFPATLAGKAFTLVLNSMNEQYDTTYFNGVEIGHSGDEPPLFTMAQRRYVVPGKLVKAGKNVIAMRVVSASPGAELLQRGAFGDYNLPLDRKAVGNHWRVNVESLFPRLTPAALRTRPRPNPAALQSTPTILYNAMIYPLTSYRIRGVVWYQGESNTARPALYDRLFAAMIADWRRQWGQGDFPFEFVQLASYLQPPRDPGAPSGWAALREAQARTLETVPNTGMAVAIDLGEADNIHPANKEDVGRRLALCALAGTYGRRLESSGPAYQSMTVEPGRIRLRFSHADGLEARGGPLARCAIAGSDRRFHWADARVDGGTVIVSSHEVTRPVAVRYAWADNPEGCNLSNSAGLPASPFRTDDWPLSSRPEDSRP